MNNCFLLLLMIFLHIVDDYYLQGILASMKQKEWWHKAAPEKMYRYDYIVALIMHGFSWAFMIMLPIAISMEFQCPIGFIFAFLVNFIVHKNISFFLFYHNFAGNQSFFAKISSESLSISFKDRPVLGRSIEVPFGSAKKSGCFVRLRLLQ